MALITKLLFFFDRRDKAVAAGLLCLMVVGAAFEAMGTALVFPFISLINDPEAIHRYPLLTALYTQVGAPSVRAFLIWCGLGLVGVYLLKSAYLTSMYYVLYRVIFSRQVALSTRLFDSYMRSPYLLHVQRNSAELLRNVNSDVLWVFSGILVPGLSVVVESLVMAAMMTLLLIVEPLPAIVALIVIGSLGAATFRPLKTVTEEAGRAQQIRLSEMIQWVQQGLGGVKEAKVLGRERFFVEAYRTASRGYARAMLVLRTASEVPRLSIEGLAVSGLLVFIVTMLSRGQDMRLVLPTMSVFALASMRLMASLNRVLAALTFIRYYAPSVDVVYRDLTALRQPDPAHTAADEELRFTRAIELRDICFRYPGANEPALNDVSLTIEKGQSVGIVGPSGSGKTTLVDVIVGLLPPAAGSVRVDGVDVATRPAAWQRTIGYIPQPIYLCDDTVRRNVAFGLADEHVDDARVWCALRAAQLEEFVAGLPEGLGNRMGEHGVKVSAGQRQRIGIARALYHDPSVLVLDEATSALDSATEAEVTRALAELRRRKTVIIIAHRLSTVRDCDVLFLLKDGALTAAGDYEAMLHTSREFRDMVEAAKFTA